MPRNNAKLIVAGALVVGLGLIATRAVELVRRQAGTSAGPGASASAAPDIVVVPPIALTGAAGVAFDPVARRTARFVLWGKPSRACETTAELDAFRCEALPAAVARPSHAWQERGRFPDHVGSAPLHFFAGGLLRVRDGAVIAEGAVGAAAIDARGDAVWIRDAEKVTLDFVLVRRPAGGDAGDALGSLRAAGARFERIYEGGRASEYPPAVFAPWLLETYERGVRARRVLPLSDPVGEPVSVIETDEIPRWLGACETESGLAVAASRGGRALVLYERGGKWSHVEGDEGRLVVDPDPVDRPARIDCAGDEVSFSWVETSRPRNEAESAPSTLHRIRCTPRGCDRWRSRSLAFAGSGPWHRADWGTRGPHLDAQLAVVGDRLLVTWRAPDGVRMRVGAPDAIADAPDRLLAKGASEVELETRRGAALAFVALDGERSAVFRIGANGEVRAVGELRP